MRSALDPCVTANGSKVQHLIFLCYCFYLEFSIKDYFSPRELYKHLPEMVMSSSRMWTQRCDFFEWMSSGWCILWEIECLHISESIMLKCWTLSLECLKPQIWHINNIADNLFIWPQSWACVLYVVTSFF